MESSNFLKQADRFFIYVDTDEGSRWTKIPFKFYFFTNIVKKQFFSKQVYFPYKESYS